MTLAILCRFLLNPCSELRQYLANNFHPRSVDYAAPEFLLEMKTRDTSYDIWALGVVFCEMLTLRHPVGSNNCSLEMPIDLKFFIFILSSF